MHARTSASGGWEIVMMKVNRTTTFIERSKVSNKDMKIAAVTTFTTLLYAFVTVDDCICVLHPIKTSIKKSFKTNGNGGSLNVPSTGNLCPKHKLDSTQTTSKASIYLKM
ncbi:hypothetical protein GQX74_002376 [Glossina fuscipes]|nr:hypothetical protein GQX74_002376 [Glossina fuscipes]